MPGDGTGSPVELCWWRWRRFVEQRLAALLKACNTRTHSVFVFNWLFSGVSSGWSRSSQETSADNCSGYFADQRLSQSKYWTEHSKPATTVWHSDSMLVLINKVNLRWAGLVLGWLTVSRFDSRGCHFISVCNQPPRSTEPCTLKDTVKWVPAKRWWCSVAAE